MASINIPIDKSLSARLERFSWVNWSDVARHEANKRRIFEEFKKMRKLSKEDSEFCNDIDWHPVDELPLNPEFIKALKIAEKGKHKQMSLAELDKLMGLK